ncbi:MAG TPA: helical backbone metal receptor [Bacteroidia bacterium]|nr:helical backbone metal receptor [Bacteroidia bacterium]
MTVISTVPSQTELLFDLGLREEVTGITKFCVHPSEWFHTKTRIGGTKNLNIKKIVELNPDLIIANKEENVKEQIEELSRKDSAGKKQFRVYVSDVKNLDDALKMIFDVGELVNKKEEAEKIIKEIKNHFRNLIPPKEGQTSPDNYRDKLQTVLYLIWRKPFMTAGQDTFIHDMLTRCGLKNSFGNLRRYPEVTPGQIASVQPDFIFLSSEPYPFKEKHMEELKIISPASKIILVNGEYFSWYGSRLLKAAEYFRKLREEMSHELH